jgi:hypothetical protein
VFDYPDIASIRDALKRGFAVDWRRVRQHWASHPLTDPLQLCQLLDEWTGALEVLYWHLPVQSSGDVTTVTLNVIACRKLCVSRSRIQLFAVDCLM